MKRDVKILVCAHKPGQTAHHPYLLPIHCGAAASKYQLPIQRDDEGENISAKNPNWCELTAHYWLWKNCKGDYAGLMHYRRYFDFTKAGRWLKPYMTYDTPAHYFAEPYGIPEDIDELFNRCDIIQRVPVVRNRQMIRFMTDFYPKPNDMKLLRDIIKELTPDYLPAFDRQMYHSRKVSACNMFIARWDVFDGYSAWMFRILEEMERRADLTGYTAYEARIFGFMSEYLLNIYVLRHGLRRMYLPVVHIDDDIEQFNPRNHRLPFYSRLMYAIEGNGPLYKLHDLFCALTFPFRKSAKPPKD